MLCRCSLVGELEGVCVIVVWLCAVGLWWAGVEEEGWVSVDL